jgi:type IV pilus assembly protein PilW
MKMSMKKNGFSLVELMVAMLLGLFLVGGMIQVFIGNKVSYQMQDALSYMQENARFALETMAYATRHAGYGGCNETALFTNTVEDPNNEFVNFQLGITGYEGGKDTFPTSINGAISNTDAIFIHTVDTDNSYFVTDHNASSAQFKVDRRHNIKSDNNNRPILIMAASDCSELSVFAYTGPTNNNGTAQNVVHNKANSGSPQNCTKALRGGHDCTNAPNNNGLAYQDGSTMFQLSSRAYYIDESSEDATIPALYQLPYDGSAQELVEGVEDMAITYGVDVDDDGVPDRYVKANTVNTTASLSWGDVLSVRYSVLVRSRNRVIDGSHTYTFDGTSATSTDGFHRQEYTTTVMIRNRG